jgi:hypothetical protein
LVARALLGPMWPANPPMSERTAKRLAKWAISVILPEITCQ